MGFSSFSLEVVHRRATYSLEVVHRRSATISLVEIESVVVFCLIVGG